MIIKEFLLTRKDGVNLYKIYSDKGFKILKKQTKMIHNFVIDVENANFEYEETDIKIEKE